MKKTMNNFFRLKPLSILCLSLASLTIFSACRDDIADAPDREHQGAQIKATEDYIGKVNIAIEADVTPMSDQEGRGLNYSLIDRSKKIEVDKNTVPSGKDYSGEVAPRMSLEEGSTVYGFLIFIHDDGTVIRESVPFKVIEGVKKKDGSIVPTAKNRVQYVGDIEFPKDQGITLKEEFNNPINSTIPNPYDGRIDPNNTTKKSRWHVMAMIGYQDATRYFSDRDATGTEIKNRLLIGSNEGTSYKLSPTESFDDAWDPGNSIYMSTPCASEWRPLYITKAPDNAAVTGVNLELHFKPQGVILQYDIASMAIETQDLRRVGLVSNVLDFSGYYDLNSASIQHAFNTKDANDYGLPTWVPDNPSMEDLSMHYTPKSDAHLSNGERVFPWDMPTLSSNHTLTLENWSTPGTNKWEVEQASVLSVYPLGHSDENTTGRPKSYPWLKAQNLWYFYALGGFKEYQTINPTRKILYFWGMPRTEARMPEASKRATYLFASSYSLMTDEDAWDAPNGFDTGKLKELTDLAIDYSNDLVDKEKAIKTATHPDTIKKRKEVYQKAKNDYENKESLNKLSAYFPGPTFTAAREAINKSIEYTRAANDTKITPRTQPLMVLHQTNRTFPERKVYHAQVVIRPDLMLSEVIYQKHGGQNYSLLEVYNTTVEPVDLSQYAIVRLIPSADKSHLAFRGSNGQAVESLSQALVLPLTALKGGTDPFADSKLSSLKQSGHNYDDAANRARPIYYETANYEDTNPRTGLWPGIWNYGLLIDNAHPDRPLYLLAGQSILLGGSGYVNSPVTKKEYYDTVNLIDPDSWFKPINELLKTNKDNVYLRYAYAYADGVKTNNTFGEGTLDYEPGNAFALIKKTSTGWQIIDATGPVGPSHLAFAGTYASFKEEMDKHKNSDSFSQQRLDGVNYPFIAPFRTKRLYNDNSHWSDDWSIKTDVNQFTPGRRFYYGWKFFYGSWKQHIKRTPIDENFSTYQNARPTKEH